LERVAKTVLWSWATGESIDLRQKIGLNV